MENLNINTYHSTDEINPEVWDVLLLRRKLDLLLRTGKLLMESAADTNRIERNMKRVAAFMNIPEEKLHIDIRWTMIMVNVSDEQHSFSKFQKCENHAINMTMISQISKLSFKATEENYSLDDYEKELEKNCITVSVKKPWHLCPFHSRMQDVESKEKGADQPGTTDSHFIGLL